jgi:hypothetical protein
MLVMYFGAMVFLHVFVLWHSWRGIRIGLPDFSIFYTAGQIVHQGRGADLYDDHLQEEIQRSFSPEGIRKRGSILPYNHPPFEAILFVPLARFSYLTAYFIWLALNIMLVSTLPFILRPHLAILGKEHLWFWLLMCLAFFPIFVALIQGQDSILVLVLYCLAYAAFRRGEELRSGSWLGLGLFKFHLVLPFVLPLLLLWRKKLLAGFLIVAAALLCIGFVPGGLTAWLTYPTYVWESEHNQSYLWNLSLGNTANLRGLISSFVPASHPWMRAGMLTFCSGLVLAAVVYAWRKAFRVCSSGTAWAFCISLIATVLLSYHIYTHDLSLLFLACVLALEVMQSKPLVPEWRQKAVYICLAILSCSPVYLTLTLRYKQLQLVAGILLILLAVLWTQCISRSIDAECGREIPLVDLT